MTRTLFLYTKDAINKIKAAADERFDAVEFPMKLRDATHYRVRFKRRKRLSPKNAIEHVCRVMHENIDLEYLSLFSKDTLQEFVCDPANLTKKKKHWFMKPISIITDYETVQDGDMRVMRLVTTHSDQWM
jgi:hypothetical protein